MSLSVQISSGARGEAIALDGERLSLVIDAALAPGQPVTVEIALADGGEALSVEGKSLGSKRRADDRFDVSLRLVSLRRDVRERLAVAFKA